MTDESHDLPKAYSADKVEDAIYESWTKAGYFSPDNLPNLENRTESFSIVLPPPNVTGTLHMGHAAMLAIEDAMTRYARMSGKRAVWIPGTDHAAIATQTKVEKLLIKDGMEDPRHELGREKFLDRVKQFAQESHDTIVNQVKKMGASVDWSREAYTLDEPRHRAVNEAFRRMHDDGLIYQGDRVINWCPRCKSTLADDEVEYKEGTATLYTFKYDADFPISISTTRPETKLGDTAVAVNPKDDRYKSFVGKTFDVQFAGGPLKITVIADEEVDMEYGTGALGVTPAHSKIDEDMAKKNDLPFIKVIDEDGKMTKESGMEGEIVLSARNKVVDWLREHELMEAEEDIPQNLSVCYRCGEAIEPLPKKQWFIDVNKEFAFKASKRAPIKGLKDGQKATLKSLMQYVVREGDIEILPERFDKTYFHWIDNLRDWNISRQIWFGHRVPVWYKDDEITVGYEPTGDGWRQDTDTLDTWFSSGLWTFSTLGWPDDSEDLQLFHPTSVMETGYDILFFWVARMILMSTYLLGEVPFKTVYLHGLIRDEQGRKMSKSLDNNIDPLDMIKDYGADATRLSLLIGATPGADMKLSEEKISSFRNFTNKLWNIARYVFSTVDIIESVASVEPETLADKWILGRLSEVTASATEHYEKYEYSLIGEELREFTWNEFADWYLEIAKVQKSENTDKVLLYVLERLLKLWHPFMPFVTEELYKPFDQGMIIVADWPKAEYKITRKDREVFDMMQGIVTAIRNVRARYKISYKKPVDVIITTEAVADMVPIIEKLSGAKVTIDPKASRPEQSAGFVIEDAQVYVPLAGVVNLEEEIEHVKEELTFQKDYAASLEKKLAGEFVKKAPENIVEHEREKLEKAQEKIQALQEELTSLT